MTGLVAWLLVLMGFAEASPLQIEINGSTRELYSERNALIIAESAYQNQAWASLEHVQKEIDLLHQTLDKQGFVVKVERDLSGDELRTALHEFATLEGSKEGSAALVWYVGHGTTFRGRGYLVPVDAPVTTDSQFKKIAVEMGMVRQEFTTIQSLHTLLVINACFSGAIFETMGEQKGYEAPGRADREYYEYLLHPGLQIIARGAKDVEVPANETFARAFTDAVRGESVPPDGPNRLVTANKIALHLTNVDLGGITPKIQNVGQNSGDFVFSPVDTNPATEEDLKSTTPQRAANSDSAAQNESGADEKGDEPAAVSPREPDSPDHPVNERVLGPDKAAWGFLAVGGSMIGLGAAFVQDARQASQAYPLLSSQEVSEFRPKVEVTFAGGWTAIATGAVVSTVSTVKLFKRGQERKARKSTARPQP